MEDSLIGFSLVAQNLSYCSLTTVLCLRYETIPVIHCCSGALNPIQWDFIVNFSQRFYRTYPLNECYRVPSTHFHSSRFLFELNFYVKHMGPAYLIDLLNSFWGARIRYAFFAETLLILSRLRSSMCVPLFQIYSYIPEGFKIG